jgi:hypothetical protein
MATARELIEGALRLIGQLAEGETASNETYSDSLVALNQMLESWSLDRLNVPSLQEQTVTWPANQQSRTLGATGDIVAERPTSIDHAYIVVDSVSYPLVLVTDEQYNDIMSKETTAERPWCLRASMTVPDASLSVYPVPTANIEMHIVSIEQLDQPAELTTELVLAPGYLRAFRHNLALELAAEFGKTPSPGVIMGAQKSLAAIQRNNTPLDTLRMPTGMPGCTGMRPSIYEG